MSIKRIFYLLSCGKEVEIKDMHRARKHLAHEIRNAERIQQEKNRIEALKYMSAKKALTYVE